VNDLVSDLRAQTLFQNIEADDIARVAQHFACITVDRDDHVFRVGSASEGLYLIRSGRVEVSKTTTDGWRQSLVVLTKGHFLGEIALLEKTTHATDARALEPTELYVMSGEQFYALEQQEPGIMLKIIKNIAVIQGLNIRRMNEKFLNALINY